MIFQNIKARCSENGVSIWELERSVGLGNGVVGKWRVQSPNVASLKKVADYFGCTIDDLMEGEEEGGGS